MNTTNTHTTIVMLAAGMGTRYGGLKQIEPIGPNGETIMDYNLHDAMNAGFDRVLFIIRKDFEETFRANVSSRYAGSLRVDHAFQSIDDIPHPFTPPPDREKPWGTTHAIYSARGLLDGPFCVINADDFYGRESFQNHIKFFQSLEAQKPSPALSHYAMAGYRLSQTLSEHGTVARGICRVAADGLLQSIAEHTRIRALPHGGAEDITDPSHPVRFTGDEPASMNNWAFTPDFIGHLARIFPAWLEKNHTNPKAEWYLPGVVDELIADRLADVRLLPTSSPWFGVTYREDLPLVQARLAALIDAGEYPARLW